MRPSTLAVIALSLSLSPSASASPLFHKRQQGDGTTGATSVTVVDGAGTTTTTLPAGDGSTTTTPPESPGGATPSPPPPSGGDNDCQPCTAYGYRTYTSPNGRTCYCLGGATDPWEWSDKRCVNDYVGLPNDEERPYFCLGSGSNPNSRACLSQCNFMLNTVNSANPCNANLYNAARVCATCVPGGAIHYQLDGRSPGGPYIQDEGSMNTFMDGLKNWCARPSRCIELSTGGRMSGTGGCPVVSDNSPSSPARGSTSTRPGGSTTTPAGPSTIRAGTTGTLPSRIVTTSTISTTDAEGRPTFSLQLATIDNPDFTGNSQFAGARPTAASEEGGARLGKMASACTAATAAMLGAVLLQIVGY